MKLFLCIATISIFYMFLPLPRFADYQNKSTHKKSFYFAGLYTMPSAPAMGLMFLNFHLSFRLNHSALSCFIFSRILSIKNPSNPAKSVVSVLVFVLFLSFHFDFCILHSAFRLLFFPCSPCCLCLCVACFCLSSFAFVFRFCLYPNPETRTPKPVF